MNYGKLKQRVTWFLDRTDLTSMVSSFVNEVRLDIATEYNWPWLWTDAYLTTEAGSSDYALPDDYLDHLHVLLNKKKLPGYTQRDWDTQMYFDEDWDEPRGEPTEYMIVGQTLRLKPAPDGEYILRLYYYARPPDFTMDYQDDYMSLTYPYMIIHRAVLLGAIFLDDTQKIKMHAPLADKELAKAVKKEKAKKFSDVAVQFRTYKDFDKGAFKNRLRLSGSNRGSTIDTEG